MVRAMKNAYALLMAANNAPCFVGTIQECVIGGASFPLFRRCQQSLLFAHFGKLVSRLWGCIAINVHEDIVLAEGWLASSPRVHNFKAILRGLKCCSPERAFSCRIDFRNARCVSPTFKRRAQERVHDISRRAQAHDSRPDAKHIGVIMLARHPRA
jgi:hypothetical protein